MLKFHEESNPLLFDYLLIIRNDDSDEKSGFQKEIIFPSNIDDLPLHLQAIGSFCFCLSSKKTMKNTSFSFCLTDAEKNPHFVYITIRLNAAYCVISDYFHYNFFIELSKNFSNVNEKNTFLKIISSKKLVHMATDWKFIDPPPGIRNTQHMSPDAEMMELYKFLFCSIPVHFILILLVAVMLDNKIVVISSCLEKLSKACYSILSLIHPLSWSGSFIPICPNSMTTCLDAPFPYIIGIHSTAADDLLKDDYLAYYALNVDCHYVACVGQENLPENIIRYVNAYAKDIKALINRFSPIFPFSQLRAQMRRFFTGVFAVAYDLDPTDFTYKDLIANHMIWRNEPSNKFSALISQSQTSDQFIQAIESKEADMIVFKAFFPNETFMPNVHLSPKEIDELIAEENQKKEALQKEQEGKKLESNTQPTKLVNESNENTIVQTNHIKDTNDSFVSDTQFSATSENHEDNKIDDLMENDESILNEIGSLDNKRENIYSDEFLSISSQSSNYDQILAAVEDLNDHTHKAINSNTSDQKAVLNNHKINNYENSKNSQDMEFSSVSTNTEHLDLDKENIISLRKTQKLDKNTDKSESNKAQTNTRDTKPSNKNENNKRNRNILSGSQKNFYNHSIPLNSNPKPQYYSPNILSKSDKSIFRKPPPTLESSSSSSDNERYKRKSKQQILQKDEWAISHDKKNTQIITQNWRQEIKSNHHHHNNTNTHRNIHSDKSDGIHHRVDAYKNFSSPTLKRETNRNFNDFNSYQNKKNHVISPPKFDDDGENLRSFKHSSRSKYSNNEDIRKKLDFDDEKEAKTKVNDKFHNKHHNFQKISHSSSMLSSKRPPPSLNDNSDYSTDSDTKDHQIAYYKKQRKHSISPRKRKRVTQSARNFNQKSEIIPTRIKNETNNIPKNKNPIPRPPSIPSKSNKTYSVPSSPVPQSRKSRKIESETDSWDNYNSSSDSNGYQPKNHKDINVNYKKEKHSNSPNQESANIGKRSRDKSSYNISRKVRRYDPESNDYNEKNNKSEHQNSGKKLIKQKRSNSENANKRIIHKRSPKRPRQSNQTNFQSDNYETKSKDKSVYSRTKNEQRSDSISDNNYRKSKGRSPQNQRQRTNMSDSCSDHHDTKSRNKSKQSDWSSSESDDNNMRVKKSRESITRRKSKQIDYSNSDSYSNDNTSRDKSSHRRYKNIQQSDSDSYSYDNRTRKKSRHRRYKNPRRSDSEIYINEAKYANHTLSNKSNSASKAQENIKRSIPNCTIIPKRLPHSARGRNSPQKRANAKPASLPRRNRPPIPLRKQDDDEYYSSISYYDYYSYSSSEAV